MNEKELKIIERISNEIEKEPAICAKLLNVANSALDGSKIGSIDQAVNIIGLQNLKSLLFFPNQL